MTAFQIKFIAAVIMVIDHVGWIFFPKVTALTAIGRLSFPLFAWAVGQGEKYTKNFKAYLLRLTIWGIISQPIYFLAFHDYRPNILITLAFGLAAIRLDKLANTKFIFAIILAALAQFAKLSYGAYGIFVIILLAKFEFYNRFWWMKWISLNLLVIFLPLFKEYQALAVFAPVIIGMFNGQQGQKAKWFYAFYPAHLLSLVLGKLAIAP